MAVTRLGERTEAAPLVVGEGVVLRRPQASHYEAWAGLRERSRAFLTPWEPSWAGDDLTRAGYRRRLRRYQREARDGLAAPYLVFRQSDGALVGGCNLNAIRRGVNQSASLGYWVGEPYRRRGYTLAAVYAVLAEAFDGLGLNRVEAACIPTNEASRALLEQAGFRREGLARAYLRINGAWRDHVLYALVRADRT